MNVGQHTPLTPGHEHLECEVCRHKHLWWPNTEVGTSFDTMLRKWIGPNSTLAWGRGSLPKSLYLVLIYVPN